MSLQKIQAKLKAPKSQYNEFGKYKYRNQEDILEALKPVLAEFQYSIVIGDTIELVSDRVYIKAKATLYASDMNIIASNTAYAREPVSKKGMDESQITGAASSYARKYALNGLFALDDTKDADGLPQNGNGSNKQERPQRSITEKQATTIRNTIAETGADEVKFCAYMGVEKIEDILVKDFNKAVGALEAKKNGGKK